AAPRRRAAVLRTRRSSSFPLGSRTGVGAGRPSILSGGGERDQPSCLELGLRPLAVGVAPPRDAGTGTEAEDAVAPPERADADGELGRATVGVDPADGPAVRAAGLVLERVDDAQRRGLRRAGDRRGR